MFLVILVLFSLFHSKIERTNIKSAPVTMTNADFFTLYTFYSILLTEHLCNLVSLIGLTKSIVDHTELIRPV
jgi:hypothetical protein